jgi:hypothetical protein
MERMKRKNKTRYARLTLSVIIVMTVLCTTGLAQVAEPHWPREIVVPQGKIVMYQPQLESFKANKLTARAAVSVTPKGQTEPIFGSVWIDARISTDRNARTVELLGVEIPEAKFPNADPDKVVKLTSILKEAIMKWDTTISLDRILTQLDLVVKEKTAAENLKSTPPKIIFVTYPAVLVTIDGEPQLQKIENSSLMRVVNTPFFIVFKPDKKAYYIKGGGNWFTAQNIMGPWRLEPHIPISVVIAAQEASHLSQEEAGSAQRDRIPQIIVAVKPTELIVLDGQPRYTPIFGTDLMYVTNTESDVFRHIGTQLNFVLLSGRWFASTKLSDGRWSHVSADKLPVDFTKIPIGSAKSHVLVNVAGTREAREAVLDTYIPQTATVKRSEAKVDVVYDGDPKFAKIEDTDMYYALNTPYSVIQYGNNYYCCHDGVWFVANSPLGPWAVCVAVPQVIYTMPPSSPVYPVKYVRVYSHTPEVVYVGYTPGYVGSYVYGGTVVYGTGYVYPGWYHVNYYPRPVTWGVAVRYNPYAGGWVVSASPAARLLRSAARYEFWDHRLDDRWGRRRGDVNINVNRNVYAGRGGVPGPGGARDPRGVADPRGVRDPRGIADPRGARDPRGPVTTQPVRSGDRRNNVYADRDGNVNRKTDKGWQQRDRSGWSESKRSTTQLDRQSSARQRGTDRTNHYNRSRSSGRSRSGGRRGGRR